MNYKTRKPIFILLLCLACSSVFALKDVKHVPYIKGDWQLLFQPQKTGSYINDHTVYRHTDGSWHVIGITRTGGADPQDERYFAHGSSPELITEGGFTEHDPICDYGQLAYAPHAINHEGVCHLFWGPMFMWLDTSGDMFNWKHEGRLFDAMDTEFGRPFRDTMTLKVGDKWLMYSTGLKDGLPAVNLWESTDLHNWKEAGQALTFTAEALPATDASTAESPHVVKHGDWYYLFVTHTDCAPENYHQTLVFRSKDPRNFGEYDGSDSRVITRLASHAPEIVHDPDTDKWYITTCGWFEHAIVRNGAVMIAELGWHKEGEELPEKLKGKEVLNLSFETMPEGACRIELAEGKVGKAARFNGWGSRIDIPDLHLNNDFTVALWVKMDEYVGEEDGIIGKKVSGQNIHLLDGKLHFHNAWKKNMLPADRPVEAGKWTHIAIVREGHCKVTYYINGEPAGGGEWTGSFMPEVLGRGNLGPRFGGLMDEVQIHSRALSIEKIKVLAHESTTSIRK